MENVVTQKNPKGKNTVKNLVPTPISIPMCAVCACDMLHMYMYAFLYLQFGHSVILTFSF